MEPGLGVSVPSGDPGLVGRTFGQYRVLSLIQRGGMGEIYLAELAPQKIRVVLKRLQETHTTDERYVEMFQNEAAVMSELEHPNIVKVLGVPVIEGKQCLVMEFVRGRNLQQILRRLRKLGRTLPPGLAIHVMRKTLLGLHEAHQARFPDGRSLDLVHRDVKPGNILISFAGDVKITDFGIAKSALQNRLTTAGVVKGTVRYLAPEQIRSEKITCRSDLFSCATVLVEILSDQPLFDRGPVAPTLMAILNDDRAPIHELIPFRAPALAQVLERALHRRPGDRFESAMEFAHALGAAGRSLGPPIGGDELGALVRQLFQGSEALSENMQAEDVTYLLVNENPSSGARKVTGRSRGAEPLDANEFRRGPPPLPQEYLEADARAEAILNEQVVIDEPVELPPLGDDLDIELDEEEGLELPEENNDPVAEPSPGDLSMAVGSGLVEEVFADPPVEPAKPRKLTPVGQIRQAAKEGQRNLSIEDPANPRLPKSTKGRSARSSSFPRSLRPQEDEVVSNLRLYLLVGCLGGVLLTCTLMAALGYL